MTELENNLTQILSEKSTKIIPENIKKGVTIFDITGTAETSAAGVKLFKTEEEMQADSEATEGDLAVVYRSEIQNMTSTTETASITFPEKVVLPTAYTGSTYCMIRAVDSSVMFDGNCELSQTSFQFDGYSNTGMIRVQYTSEDGITYTRTRFQGDSGDLTNPVDLGTIVKVEQAEEWNDNFGYFMQTGGSTFEGLYKYTSYQLLNLILYNLDINNYDFNNKVYTGNKTYQNNLQDAFNIIHENYYDITILFLTSDLQYGYAIRGGNKPDGSGSGGMSNILQYFNNKMYKVTGDSVTDKTYIVLYKFNMSDGSLVETTDISSTQTTSPFKYNRGVTPLPEDATCFIITTKDNDFASINGYNDSNSETEITVLSKEYTTDYKYKLASTQLSLSNVNQLLPGKIAYGSNGIITGDEAIYDNLDMTLTTKHLLPGISTDSASDHIITLDSRYIRKNK